MRIDEVNLATLNEILLAETRGVVLDFWGTWCQPCRTLRPHVEALADDYADSWRFVAVHIDENPDVVDRYDVSATPTFVFVRGGTEIRRIVGAVPPSALAEALGEHS